MKAEDRLLDLEAAYWRALKEGRIKMKPGVKTLDIAEKIRSGDLAGIKDLLEPSEKEKNKDKDKSETASKSNPKQKPTNKPKSALDDGFIPQTFDVAGDADMEARLRALEAKGDSIIGEPERFGEGTAPKKDTYRDRALEISNSKSTSTADANRRRAEAIVNNSSSSRNSTLRARAAQIDQRATAIEAERLRQERIRQEQIRQAQIQQELYRQQVLRQQQQEAYNRAVAQQQWRQQLMQQRLQQQQQNYYPRPSGPYLNGLDGSILGPDYYKQRTTPSPFHQNYHIPGYSR